MQQQKPEKLSNQIKVSVENGIAIIDHSDAYNAQMEKFFAGESFSKQEKLANQKLIEAEDLLMEAARRDPVGFLKRQENERAGEEVFPLHAADEVAKPVAASSPESQATEVSPPNGSDKKLADAERLERATQAFAEASPEDRAIAQKNLEGIQAQLINVPYMTPEFLAQAQRKAYVDEGEKLYERNIAANKKDNALPWEVANYSQAPGKNMVNADVAASVGTGNVGFSASASHGFDATAAGLTLAEVNAGASTDNLGATAAQVGLKAVKQVYEDGTHHVFVAGGANATVAALDANPTLGGNATALLVNAHQVGGRPTAEIVGTVVDLPTGNATLVGSVSQTFNADTKQATTTARAVGTYGVESGAVGFNLELYQKTGLENLTARFTAGLNDVGDKNDPAVSGGFSLGF